METDRLKQFCLIIETGSLSKSAELLGISHGGLSKSMGVLQVELGLTLFQAHGRGIIPTDEGRALYRRAQDVLEKLAQLKAPRELGAKTQFNIGMLEVFGGPVLTKSVLENIATESHFEILELSPGQIEVSLRNGKIDLGFTYLPVPTEGIEFLKITKFKFGIYAKKSSFRGVNSAELPFVAPVSEAPSNPMGIKERDVWPEGLFPRQKVFQVNLLSTALTLAQHGHCAIFIPEFVAKFQNEVSASEYRLEELPLPPHFPKLDHHVYLAKRVSTMEDAMMKKLAATIRKLCG